MPPSRVEGVLSSLSVQESGSRNVSLHDVLFCLLRDLISERFGLRHESSTRDLRVAGKAISIDGRLADYTLSSSCDIVGHVDCRMLRVGHVSMSHAAVRKWKKLMAAQDIEALMRTARLQLPSPQKQLMQLLRLTAVIGGAAHFAEILGWIVQQNIQIDVDTYHKVLVELVLRVPTPVAMVRLALNLTAQRPEDLVPLIPSGFGDEPSKSELFQGCCPASEVSNNDAEQVDKAYASLSQVDSRDLIGKIQLSPSAAGFADYYSHFLPLLHLDFLEELRQKHWMWERPASFLAESGHAALRLKPEPGPDGKHLMLLASGPGISKMGLSPGSTLLLSKTGVSVLHGGAIHFAQVAFMQSPDSLYGIGRSFQTESGVAVAVDISKEKIKKICREEEFVDAYLAVNLVAYQRQLDALKRLVTLEQRFPLWELLPLSGVGGDIVDPWATKMRSKLKKARSSKMHPVSSPVSSGSGSDINALKLRSLAEEDPSLNDGFWSPRDRLRLSGELTSSQQQAVVAAVKRRLTVIQGPPGTGKTHVSVEILQLWARQEQVTPILVTSHNNVAVDNIAEAAYIKGLDVVRVGKADRLSPAMDEFSLDSILPRDESETPTQRTQRMRTVLTNADVICITTIASASRLLKGIKFGAILMDEAAQTTELSALVPLAHLRADRLVLVGDQCQLPATALSLEAETRGLTLSLFQRLVLQGFPSFFLDTQFRMHPRIAEHSSDAFYSSKLLSGVTSAMRPPPAGFEWPCPSEGVAFIDTGLAADCVEEKNRLSWCNPGEAVLVTQILLSVLHAGDLQACQIGVVTPYMGQVRTLRRLMRKYMDLSPEALPELQVASVDGFQGREKELIIVSAVRCNRAGQVGFLADWRRLNVTLTRARRGLIVVGNAWTLRADPFWRSYVDWAKKEGFAMDFNLPKRAAM